MYWIYLIIFVLVALTPKLIQEGNTYLKEEDIETLLILCFGVFGFIIYLAKEKALLRIFREKLRLQKQTNIITQDLSNSYSYIGEMNRKIDIVNEFIFNLPKMTAVAFEKKNRNIYGPLLETASLLAKTDQVILLFVNTQNKERVRYFEKKSSRSLVDRFDSIFLLDAGKFFWEEDEYVIVRSPRQAKHITAFLIFSRTRNHAEDEEVFKILVSEALLLYYMEQSMALKQANE